MKRGRKKGHIVFKKTRKKISEANKRSYERGVKLGFQLKDEHWNWKGNDVGYSGVHHWIREMLGKPMKCEHCGRTDKKKYEWANKNHKYRRNVDDWMRLCTKCHIKYDKERKQNGRQNNN